MACWSIDQKTYVYQNLMTLQEAELHATQNPPRVTGGSPKAPGVVADFRLAEIDPLRNVRALHRGRVYLPCCSNRVVRHRSSHRF